MPKRDEQSGFTLLLFVIVLLGIGGTVLAGYMENISKQVSKSRNQHNKDVLEQAKQALLMYAYRYPSIAGRGPGRLPCPDTNNTGTPNPPCQGLDIVGRFPWDANGMDFNDVRDSDGERLWYAVSNTFDNNLPATVINSDSVGTITLFDQNGNLIYDGAVAGIAAVIIAPGAQINNQDRSVANADDPEGTVADTDPGIVDPANYLDAFNGFDNSAFADGGNLNADGFILGPVFNPAQNSFVINDQIVVITTRELVDVAEKSVLDTYKRAINGYRINTSGIYPWLDDFTTTDLTVYDADINTIHGRVPAVFEIYFSGNPIPAYNSDTRFRFIPANTTAVNLPHTIEYLPAPDHPQVSFNAGGNLVTSLDSSAATVTLYFWDGHETNTDANSPNDGVFELCEGTVALDTLNPEDNCNRTAAGTFKFTNGVLDPGDDTSDVWLQVYRLDIILDSGIGRFTLPQARFEAGVALSYSAADAFDHAYVYGTYNDNGGQWSVDWEYDLDFRSGFDIMENDSLDDMQAGVVYYPELPVWALDNEWHRGVQMVIDDDFAPSGSNANCTDTPPCLTLNNMGGVNNDLVSMLILAGEGTDLIDDGVANFQDDLEAIFEPENDFSNVTFVRRVGNDSVLVLQPEP